MTARARVVILGGGIAGAAVFALITQLKGLEVILLEAESVLGSGTTAKNNGRCHSGASGVFSDPPEVTARKQKGSTLLRHLPVAWQGDPRALYICADAQQRAAFADACAKRGIPLDDRVDQIASEWVTRDQLRFAFLLHEPPFDPVALTDVLAAIGRHQGGDIRLRHRAERIEVRGQLLTVKGPEFELEADLILDLTSKFGGSARLEARAPLVTIDWYRWPIMALPAATLPALNRVITSMNPDHHVPSVIPHGGWTTFVQNRLQY